MASAQITRGIIYPNEIDRIMKMPGGPIGKVVRRMCLDIAAEAEADAQVKTIRKSPHDAPRSGRYVKAFAVKVHTNPVSGFEFTVENTRPYAAILELGSKPHKIKARKAKLLRFRSRQTGQWVMVKAVDHPGMPKGWHVLENAMIKVVRAFTRPISGTTP